MRLARKKVPIPADTLRLTFKLLNEGVAAQEETLRPWLQKIEAHAGGAWQYGQSFSHTNWKGREDARLRGLAKGRKKAAAVLSAQAARAYDHVVPTVRELHEEGESLRGIARALNERGFKTRRGKEWGPVQVRLLVHRLHLGGGSLTAESSSHVLAH